VGLGGIGGSLQVEEEVGKHIGIRNCRRKTV